MSEHAQQVSLFQWAAYAKCQYPELEMLYAIPNGGKRDKPIAVKMKAEGVQAGVWDVALDVPAGDYHGLRIEMKWGSNKLTRRQKEWRDRYQRHGYATAVCYSWEDAARAILDYIGYELPDYVG